MKTNNTLPPETQAPSWRRRAQTHYQNILDLLRERRERGVTSEELYADAVRYGRSPRNRISEIRARGFHVETIHLQRDVVRYVLHAADRAADPPRPPAVVQPPSTTDREPTLFDHWGPR
jgi:hypothetical protein